LEQTSTPALLFCETEELPAKVLLLRCETKQLPAQKKVLRCEMKEHPAKLLLLRSTLMEQSCTPPPLRSTPPAPRSTPPEPRCTPPEPRCRPPNHRPPPASPNPAGSPCWWGGEGWGLGRGVGGVGGSARQRPKTVHHRATEKNPSPEHQRAGLQRVAPINPSGLRHRSPILRRLVKGRDHWRRPRTGIGPKRDVGRGRMARSRWSVATRNTGLKCVRG